MIVTDLRPHRQLSWLSGTRVGAYTLVRELARGGMAEIWLARQAAAAGIERPVVIKRIIASSEEDPSFVTMFLDEARVASLLHHSNIVQVYDFAESDGSYFLVMEYLPGETISKVVRALATQGRVIDPGLAVYVIAAAAAGLGYAHGRTAADGSALGIVHRDVSPQNIFLTYDGQVKVLDFGIAYVAGKLTHTRTGTMKGKLAYMAPEQAQSESVDARADVFSLGVILFEMLTGRRLYGQAADDIRIFTRLASPEPFPPPSASNSQIPPELDWIVARAIAKDRSQRQQDGRALQLELETWALRAGVGHAPLELLMRHLFADRIAEAQHLLSEGAPIAADAMTPSAAPSMPGLTPSVPQSGSKRRGRGVAIFLALSVLAGLAAVAVVRPRTGHLVVDTTPVGSSTFVDGVPCPAPCQKDLPAGVHVVQCTAPNFVASLRQIELHGGSTQELLVTLAPAPAPKPEPEVHVAPLVDATDAGADAAAVEAPKVAVRAKGRLSLDTSPYTRVYLGKTLLGETPILDVALPAGTQRLRLVNDDEHIDRVIEVVIEPGKATVKKLGL